MLDNFRSNCHNSGGLIIWKGLIRDNMPTVSEKVLIIGAGPAGLTAALYTARANLRPLVLEGPQPGGQLTITSDVENFPGFPEAKTGPELIDLLHRQTEGFGARFAYEAVQEIDLSKRPFRVKSDTMEILADTVIIASGASARWLELPSERALMGHGVSACATCDGFFFKGKEVIVVGGGDTALEEGLFLTRFCKLVTVVHRRDTLRASKILQDRALNHPNIRFIWDTVVDEILDPAQKKVTAARLRNVKTGELSEYPCEGVFVAVGHTPNTAFLRGQLETDAAGFLVCQGRTSHTSVPGVFAAGDVVDPRYKQAVTAAGTGCMAAIDAERFLAE